MKLITAAFSDKIDHGSLSLAVLCAEAVALDFKLRDRIDRRKHQKGGIRTNVHIVNAINSPHVGVRLVSIDGHVHVRIKAGATSGKRTRLIGRRQPGNERYQGGIIATVQWQLSPLLF